MGGRQQRPGFCCPCRHLPAMYSQGDLLRPWLYAILCCGISVVLMISGLKTTILLYSQTNSLQAAVWDVMLPLKEEGQFVAQYLAHFAVSMSSSGDVASLQPDLVYSELTANVEAMMQQFILRPIACSHHLLWLPSLLLFLLLSNSVAGVLVGSGVVRRRWSMAVSCIFMVLGIASWLLQAIAVVMHQWMKDVCLEVSELTRRRTNVVAAATNCSDSFFTPVNLLRSTLLQHLASEAGEGERDPNIASALSRTFALSASSSCRSLLRAIVPPLSFACQQTSHQTRRIVELVSVAGFVALTGMITYTIGAKRYMSMRKAWTPQYH